MKSRCYIFRFHIMAIYRLNEVRSNIFKVRDSDFMSNVVYIFESTFEGLYFLGLLGLQERDLNI